MKKITLIWIIISFIFLSLAIYHFRISNSSISHFKLSERPAKNVQISLAGADVDKPIRVFVADFNTFIDDLNKSNSRQNNISALSYFIAFITSLFSIFESSRSQPVTKNSTQKAKDKNKKNISIINKDEQINSNGIKKE